MAVSREIAEIVSEVIYETSEEYLQDLSFERFYITAEQALRLRMPVKEKIECPIGFTKIETEHRKCYVPLYDRSNRVPYIPRDELPFDYGFSWQVTHFGCNPKEEEIKGCTIHNDNFLFIYDLKTIIDRLNLPEIDEKDIKFPLFFNSSFPEGLNQNRHVVGYMKTDKRYIPLIDAKEVFKETGLELKQEIYHPYYTNSLFYSFSKQTQEKKRVPIGYAYNGSKFVEVFDVTTVFPFIKEERLDESRIIVEPEHMGYMKKALKIGYKHYVAIEGLTENLDFVIKGPNTQKWVEKIQEYKWLIEADTFLEETGIELKQDAHHPYYTNSLFESFSRQTQKKKRVPVVHILRGNKFIEFFDVTNVFPTVNEDKLDEFCIIVAPKHIEYIQKVIKSNYKQYVTIEGLTKNLDFVIKGPDTDTWIEKINEYKRLVNESSDTCD